MNTTLTTAQGKRITLISEHDLQDPLYSADRVRAFCHLHGGDTQRSLSIDRDTGWGYCFNAACHAVVLVEEMNREAATYLRSTYVTSSFSRTSSWRPPTQTPIRAKKPRPPRLIPGWQQEEVAALRSLAPQMRDALATSWLVSAYLDTRQMPLSQAQETGLCYLSQELAETSPYRACLSRWIDRLLFPLSSQQGQEYIGRSLCGWTVGMDENMHKALLDSPRTPRRWIKTNPAGWFGEEPSSLASCLILVEGGFDRLALLAAGFPANAVVALAGTTLQIEWLLQASRVKAVLLALDADAGGTEAMQRLAQNLHHAGLLIEHCPPGRDQWGKDWSERYRRIGSQCIWPLYNAYARLGHSLVSHSS